MSELSDTIRAIFTEARKTQEREPRCGVSDGHGCVRAKVYSFRLFRETGKPAAFERPARWGLAAACGTAVGQLLEEASERLGHKVQVRAAAGRISGSADIVLMGDHVIDVKVAGGWKWRKIQHEPDPEHRRQVSTYASLLSKPKWALLYIDGRSIFTAGEDVEWILHEGLAAPEHYQATSSFWVEVDKHLEAGTMPDRLEYGAFQCSVCPHTEVCWSF